MIALVSILIIFLAGVTYAFFTTIVADGDRGSSIAINTATLGLRYSEEPITCLSNGVMPGETCTHNFFVENIGNAMVDSYYVYLWDIINTFETTSDLVYEINCKSINSITKDVQGTCIGKIETEVPAEDELILESSAIDIGITHEYEIKITFKETDVNQNENQGKTFTGKILVVTENNAVGKLLSSALFTPNGNISPLQSQSVVVTVKNATVLKYVWSEETITDASMGEVIDNGASITKSNGEGEFYLCIYAEDKYGNAKTDCSDSYFIDAEAPVGNYLRINDTNVIETATLSTNVTLYASAYGDASQMCFSNTSDNTSCTWITYSSNAVAWTLTSGVGTKNVYVWFKDELENISEVMIASIYYGISKDAYSYTGNSQILDDGSGNWRIKFLTSGTFTLKTDLILDVFLVGGGGSAQYGGGAGGGYTTTSKKINALAGTSYSIVVGGANSASSGFGASAAGGKSASGNTGGAGGSGGATWTSSVPGNGGSNGGNGGNSGGAGQGTTTREFGETTGTLYAGGGGGGNGGTGGSGGGATGITGGAAGTTNTGGGASGGGQGTTRAGGSGIVIIRNAR